MIEPKDVVKAIENNMRVYISGVRRFEYEVARLFVEYLKDETIVLFTNHEFEKNEDILNAINNHTFHQFDNEDTIHILHTISMNPKNDEMAKNEIVIIGIDEIQDPTKIVKELHDYEGRIVFVDNNLNRKEDELKDIRMYVDVCL